MEQGLEPEPELEPKPEPKLGFAASWSWGAEPKEIFSAPQHRFTSQSTVSLCPLFFILLLQSTNEFIVSHKLKKDYPQDRALPAKYCESLGFTEIL
jgi:hypothetical protein